MLKIEDLTCSFGGLVAVNHCSFEIQAGTITGLIGPNGAGKSTVFNLISGMVPIQTGRITFNERRIDHLTPHMIARRGIARTFQIPAELGRMTLLENLALVPSHQAGESMLSALFAFRRVKRQENNIQQRALQQLKELNLDHLADELAQNVSTGQKKLLELGRALMSDPSLVMLDEPAAGVNPTLMRDIAARIKSLKDEKNMTFLIVEHDVPLIMDICDRVIVLAEGRVIANGEPDEVRHDKRVLDAYLGGIDT